MKLLGEGGTPYPLIIRGELKSSIWLFNNTPVDEDMTLEPKLWQKKKTSLLQTRFLDTLFFFEHEDKNTNVLSWKIVYLARLKER